MNNGVYSVHGIPFRVYGLAGGAAWILMQTVQMAKNSVKRAQERLV